MKGIHVCLLLFLLTVKDVVSYGTQGRFHYGQRELRNVKTKHTSHTMHNATIGCGLQDARATDNCTEHFFQLASPGYPWNGPSNGNGTLNDPLDSLNYVCGIWDKARTCLRFHRVPDYCVVQYFGHPAFVVGFSFICQHQRRDENLLHSLRCLRDNRMLSMLFFHIGQKCGIGNLDAIMVGRKKVFLYDINVNPAGAMPKVLPMYCLPRDVIFTCVKPMVDNQCGNMTASLVQKYIFYLQDWFAQSLESAGLRKDLCFHDAELELTGFDRKVYTTELISPSVATTPSSYKMFLRLIKQGPTDTVLGSTLINLMQDSLADEPEPGDLCFNKNELNMAFGVCMLYSEDTSERSRFNILQFAHLTEAFFFYPYHGINCNRLKPFATCWGLLQDMCGSRTRGFALRAKLLVEGCEIQALMDRAGCHWQDMLIGHYVRAGQVTQWPMDTQGLNNPMLLDRSLYDTSTLFEDLKKVISLLQPGVKEIGRKCGDEPATKLARLLHEIPYLQYDAIKYFNLAA